MRSARSSKGKQRVLARFLQRLVEIDNSLASWAGCPRPADTHGLAGPAARWRWPPAGRTAPGRDQPVLALRSQEDLRRDIVRQLHDGPAQSIANIGLQAEIVERLMDKGDPRARDEIGSLRRLVQQALDATKEFIFEIRPMVLDDLGLGPDAAAGRQRPRRAARASAWTSPRRASRSASTPTSRAPSSAASTRPSPATWRCDPPSVVVRLDWSERELVATVAGTWPRVRAGRRGRSQRQRRTRARARCRRCCWR